MNTFDVLLLVGGLPARYLVIGFDESDAELTAIRQAELDYPFEPVHWLETLYMGATAEQTLLPGMS